MRVTSSSTLVYQWLALAACVAYRWILPELASHQHLETLSVVVYQLAHQLALARFAASHALEQTFANHTQHVEVEPRSGLRETFLVLDCIRVR